MNKDYYLDRGFTAEFRAFGADKQESGHLVEGLAAVYEQETIIRDCFGEFIEVIRDKAFDQTDFSDVKLLINHDISSLPLARSRRNNTSDKPNTMKLSVDERGISIAADLDTVNNEQARALYSAIERGDLDGMSFCFFVAEDNQRWSKVNGMIKREILKVDKVVEVSAVSFPAYEGANINARSIDSDKRALENARSALIEEDKPKAELSQNVKQLLMLYGNKKV